MGETSVGMKSDMDGWSPVSWVLELSCVLTSGIDVFMNGMRILVL